MQYILEADFVSANREFNCANAMNIGFSLTIPKNNLSIFTRAFGTLMRYGFILYMWWFDPLSTMHLLILLFRGMWKIVCRVM